MTNPTGRFGRLVEGGIGDAGRLRLILDTNVLIDAIAGDQAQRVGEKARDQHERARRVVAYAFEHGTVCFTAATRGELAGVLLGEKGAQRFPEVDRQGEFNRIVARAELVEPGPLATVCVDRNDDKMIRAALGAKAAYLVTFDRGLLSLQHAGGTWILHPEDFIQGVMARQNHYCTAPSATRLPGRLGRQQRDISSNPA